MGLGVAGLAEADVAAAVAPGRGVEAGVVAAGTVVGRDVEAGVPAAVAGVAGRAVAGFKRSPIVDCRVAAGALPAAFAAGRAVAGAACGVNRSPIVGVAARGDAGRDSVPDVDDGVSVAGAEDADDEVAGLSAARAGAGRDVGAGRSLPSGGGLDPVTTGCPLLQAASSTLEKKPAQRNAMFADSARSAQCWDGGKSTQ
jgi:hypothetical protein